MPFPLREFGPWIGIALAVVVAVVFTPYLLGPILIYFTLKIAGRPSLQAFYLEDRSIPNTVRRYVLDTLTPLEEIGFAVLGAYFLQSVTNVKSFVVLICKEEAHDMALLAVTDAESGIGIGDIQQKHMEFATSFGDGSALDTNNSSQIGAFPSTAGHTMYSLPWIDDPRLLYRVHRAACERDRPDGEKVWKLKGDPAEYLRTALIQEMTRQLPTGYLYLDGAGDFRPTVKGAILITYRNLWPFSTILKRRRRRAGEELLRQLRIDPRGSDRVDEE